MKVSNLSLNVKTVLSLLAVLISSTVVSANGDLGSSVLIGARAYQTNCSYYSTSVADFSISYRNVTAQPSAAVTLVYGFHDQFSNQHWLRQGRVAMQPHKGAWRADLSAIEVDARGGFFFDEIEFAFEIQEGDRGIHWDNGGKAPMGYYFAPIPKRFCGAPQELEWLNVDAR